jgi:hypothetical protein
MAFVSTTTEIALLDTRDQQGAVLLPSTQSLAGRILLYKDIYGTASNNAVNVYTNGIDIYNTTRPDLYEDGSYTQTLSNGYDFMQYYTASTSRWYIVGGTELNAITTSVATFSTIRGIGNALVQYSTSRICSFTQSTIVPNFVSIQTATLNSISSVRFVARRTSTLRTEEADIRSRFLARDGKFSSISISEFNANLVRFSSIGVDTLRSGRISSVNLAVENLSATFISTVADLTVSTLIGLRVSTPSLFKPTLLATVFSTSRLSTPTFEGYGEFDSVFNRSSFFSTLSTTTSISTIFISTLTAAFSELSTFNIRGGTGFLSSIETQFASSVTAITSSIYVESLTNRRTFVPLLSPFVEFFATGAIQQFVVPENVYRFTVTLWGAGGQAQGAVPNNLGGSGACVTGSITTTPGTVYSIIVGVSGGSATLANGGPGIGNNVSGGGGFTGIFSGDPDSTNVIAIAGGGGGGGTNGGGVGGGGGFPNGGDGTTTVAILFGTGGTQTAGGTGAASGSQFQGGSAGGGGGGGWYGGGAGQDGGSAAGGGGGSSTYTGSLLEPILYNGFAGGTFPGTVNPAANEDSPYYQAPFGRAAYNGYLVIHMEVPTESIYYIENTRLILRANAFEYASISTISSIRSLTRRITDVKDVNSLTISTQTTTSFLFSSISTQLFSTILISTQTLSSLETRILSSGVAFISSLSTLDLFQARSNADFFQLDEFSTNRANFGYLEVVNLSTNRISTSLGFIDSLTVDILSTTRRGFFGFIESPYVYLSPSTTTLLTFSSLNFSVQRNFVASNVAVDFFSSGRFAGTRGIFSSIQTNFFFQSTFSIPFFSNVPFSANRISSGFDVISSMEFTGIQGSRGFLETLTTNNLFTSSFRQLTFSTVNLSTYFFANLQNLQTPSATINYLSSLVGTIPTVNAVRVVTRTIAGIDLTQFSSLDISAPTMFLNQATMSSFTFSTLSSATGFMSTVSTQRINSRRLITNTISAIAVRTRLLNTSNVSSLIFPFVSSVYQEPPSGVNPRSTLMSNSFDQMSSIDANRLNANRGIIVTLSTLSSLAFSFFTTTMVGDSLRAGRVFGSGSIGVGSTEVSTFISPRSVLPLGTTIPDISTSSVSVFLGNFSTLSTATFATRQRVLQLDSLETGGSNTFLTISTGFITAIGRNQLQRVSTATVETEFLSAIVLSTTIGRISSFISQSNFFFDVYISSMSSPFVRGTNLLQTSSPSISSFLATTLFTPSTVSLSSLIANRRMSSFEIDVSTSQCINVITSSFFVSTINDSTFTNLYTNLSTLEISTGRLNVSSISGVNIVPPASNIVSSLWIASGNDTVTGNRIKYSYDGINWISSGYALPNYAVSVNYDGQKMWVVNAPVLTTTDGINYTTVETGIAYSVSGGVAYNGNMWVAFGQDASVNATFKYSYDSITWFTGVNSGGNGAGRGIAYGNDQWIALTTSEATAAAGIKWSSNGITWFDSLSGSSGGKFGAYHNGNYWIVSGKGGTPTSRIQYSYDGKNWSNIVRGGFSGNSETGGLGTGANHVGWNGKMWVVVGQDSVSTNTIQYSYDGSNFYPAASGGFSSEGKGIAWNGTMWVATGIDANGNTIKYSYDGSNWLNANNGTFSLGGYCVGYSSNQATPFLATSTFMVQPTTVPISRNKANRTGFLTSSITLNDIMIVDQTGVVFAKQDKDDPVAQLIVGGIGEFITMSTQQIRTNVLVLPPNQVDTGVLISTPRIIVSSILMGDAPQGSTLGPALSRIRLGLFQGDAYKPTGSTWNITSDERTKENITEAVLDWCYNDMKQLQLRKFTYKSSFCTFSQVENTPQLGFVAQEVERILPKAVMKGDGFGYSDFCTLSMDQVQMIQYGALQKTIFDTEAIESTTFSLLSLNQDITVKLSSLEGYLGM